MCIRDRVYLDNYDNINPSGLIMYPYAGQILSGQQTISILAEDNTGIDSVDFFINNALVYTDFVEPYEYDWNTEFEFEDANHIIGSIVTDMAGNQFEIPSISVFVNNIPNDNVPPTISISNPVICLHFSIFRWVSAVHLANGLRFVI